MPTNPLDLHVALAKTRHVRVGLAIVLAALGCCHEARGGIVIDEVVIQPIGDPQWILNFQLSLAPMTTLTRDSYLILFDVPGLVIAFDKDGNPIPPFHREPSSSHYLFGVQAMGPLPPEPGGGYVDDPEIYNPVWTYEGKDPIVNNSSTQNLLLGIFSVITNKNYRAYPSGTAPSELVQPIHYGSEVLIPTIGGGTVSEITYGTKATPGILPPQGSVPVPEPSTLLGGLLATSSLGMLMRKRRVG